MDFDYCHHKMSVLTSPDDINCADRSISYNELLATNLLHVSASNTEPRSLLAIRDSAVRRSHFSDVEGFYRFRLPAQVVLPLRAAHTKMASSRSRYIPLSATCVLDAPNLRNDYYLNLMDWGSNGIIAIALAQEVYLYTTTTGKIQELVACTDGCDYVTSVAWVENTNPYGGDTHCLAVGTFLAELQIWDVQALMKVRSMRTQRGRISSLSWSNRGILATGSRDSTIHLNDVRSAQHLVGELKHHHEEVCGLAWSPDSCTLASGSNDNCLCFWDLAMIRLNGSNHRPSPRSANVEHCAAVRALAWSPWERHVLASGGGTSDGTIKLWNASSGKLLRSEPTESQVCALVWSKTTRELVSAHGHESWYQLTLWGYPTMKRVCELTGHTARVLNLAISPNGLSVASAGADETLRFWDVFPSSGLSCTRRILEDGGRFDMPRSVIR